MLVGKKVCRLKKRNVAWGISPAKNGNVRTFPGMQDRKTAEAGKNALGPIGAEKIIVGWQFIFLSVGQKKCRLEKKNASGQKR